LLPASIRRALAIPASGQTGTIQDIKHVVILMQENRSLDHYFGTLQGVRGFGDRFPITLASGQSVWQQSNGTSVLPPYHFDSTTKNVSVSGSRLESGTLECERIAFVRKGQCDGRREH
jgi:phospholipase C